MKTLKRTLLVLMIVAAAAVAAHVYLLDGLQGWLFAHAMGDDTAYAPKYSDAAFRQVHVGMDRRTVDRLLGPPMREVWVYREHAISLPTVDFVADRVVYVASETEPRLRSVTIGMTKADVRKVGGAPQRVSLVYTRTPHDQSYRVRAVMLANDRVMKKDAEFYVD